MAIFPLKKKRLSVDRGKKERCCSPEGGKPCRSSIIEKMFSERRKKKISDGKIEAKKPMVESLPISRKAWWPVLWKKKGFRPVQRRREERRLLSPLPAGNQSRIDQRKREHGKEKKTRLVCEGGRGEGRRMGRFFPKRKKELTLPLPIGKIGGRRPLRKRGRGRCRFETRRRGEAARGERGPALLRKRKAGSI